MPPRPIKLINNAAITEAVKSKENLKAFLSQKDNTSILLSNATARKAFVKQLEAAGKSKDAINKILGQVARATISTIDW